MKTANYCTIEEKNWGSQVLPTNSFVKIIDERWLPQHIKDSSEYKYMHPRYDVVIYCHFGIKIIERKLLRET